MRVLTNAWYYFMLVLPLLARGSIPLSSNRSSSFALRAFESLHHRAYDEHPRVADASHFNSSLWLIRRSVDKATSDGQTDIAEDTRCKEQPDNSVCDITDGKICVQQRCVSACSLRDMYSCRCPDGNDRHCYLCCGNAHKQCRPAHEYKVFRPNGERWERNTCARCWSGEFADGEQCDEKDRHRVCMGGRCAGSLCDTMPEGAYCVNTKNIRRICVNHECVDPCARYSMSLCECPVASTHRCELCCHDYTNGKCQNAKFYGLKHPFEDRPILRIGLGCGRFDYTCSRLGRCAGATLDASLRLLLATILYTLLQTAHCIDT